MFSAMPKFETDFKALKTAYDSGLPLSHAAAQVGVSANTASNWMRKAGIPIEYRRINSEGGTGALKHVCDYCHEEYVATHASSRFCSRDCTNAWQREIGITGTRTTRPTCPCGKEIVEANRKYCSRPCRSLYGVKRRADPANYRTRHCANETCGKEFTRYLKYGNGNTRFCSNACAQKHTKTRRFYAVEGFDIVFESSYEALFWSALALVKTPVERFDRERGVAWTTGGWYAPDFWLPIERVAVEIKGVEDEEDPARWAAYRKQRGPLIVFHYWELLRSPNALREFVKIEATKAKRRR